MLGCLNSGISGLSVNNNNMSVIANNIANVNTPGYKLQRATFADILGQESGSLTIGNGVKITNVSSVQSQGSFESTTSATDLAIDGAGLFIVKDNQGAYYYTRAGQFHFNNEGKLVNPEGYVVQGWDLMENGTITGLPQDIDISGISLPPGATENLSVAVNLDANAQIPAAFDINDPINTSNYTSSVSIYDSLGNIHDITFYFRRENQTTWDWHAATNTGGVETEQANGTLTFNENGLLVNESAITYLTGALTGFNFNNGSAADQAINIDFGASLTEGGTGAIGATQYAEEFSTKSFSQDGYPSGSLINNVSINKEGMIEGYFTNGQTDVLAVIALADFSDPAGLKKMGNNLYLACQESGQPIINPPDTAGMGKTTSHSLEGSNVDLASEFMKMIITQRAFQANARSITVADQMLTEIVSLKR